jgi:hypothetical protein
LPGIVEIATGKYPWFEEKSVDIWDEKKSDTSFTFCLTFLAALARPAVFERACEPEAASARRTIFFVGVYSRGTKNYLRAPVHPKDVI